jgi:hypothetical protein
MKCSLIDNAILSVASRHWLKVARILVDVARVKGVEVPETDKGLRIIAKRIEVLVQEGRLVAQGNLRKWRHSEVRLPPRRARNQGTARSPLRAILRGGKHVLRTTASGGLRALPASQRTRQEALRRLQFFTSGVKIGCDCYGLDWAPEPLTTLSDLVREASRRNPDWKRLEVVRKRLLGFISGRKLLNESNRIGEDVNIICKRKHGHARPRYHQ